MDKKDEKFAVDALVEHYRKTKKILDPKSIFEEYESICEEVKEKTISSSPIDLTEKDHS